MSAPIKLHYSHSKNNWGDQLSPVICKMISGRKVVYAKAGKCDLLAIGSILSRLKENFWTKSVHVWGSGFIEPVRKHKTRHIIHAVRGKKTAAILTNVDVGVFGDPGVLCDRLLPNHLEIHKDFEIGIIPHYKDRGNMSLSGFINENPKSTIIDIYSDTIDFVKKVAACRFILSSSLHGLIAADSLGIPNHWLSLSDNIVGGGFKFHDYYSVYDIPKQTPLSLDEITLKKKNEIIDEYNRPGIDHIKRSLVDAFPFKPGN